MITQKKRLKQIFLNYKRFYEKRFNNGFIVYFCFSVLFKCLNSGSNYDENLSKILVQVSEILIFFEISFNFLFIYYAINNFNTYY